MKSSILRSVAVVGLSLSAAAVSAQTELRFSHSYTEQDPRHEWAQFISDRVAEKTNNDVVINIYPNQQLAKARAQHSALQRGRIDFAIYPLPWLAGMAPLTEIGALPGLVTDPIDGLSWRDRQIWPMLEESIAATGVEFVGGGWAMGTIGNVGSPVARPEDVDGLQMRGLGGASEKMLSAYGATITSMPASELYQSLQTGVLTGVLTQYSSFEGYNLHEVIDHLQVGPGFIGGMHGLLAAPDVEEKVGAENYEHILDAIEQSEPWFAKKMIQDTSRIAEKFRDEGVELYELTDADLEAWMEASRETAWEYFVEKVPNGAKALKAVEQPL